MNVSKLISRRGLIPIVNYRINTFCCNTKTEYTLPEITDKIGIIENELKTINELKKRITEIEIEKQHDAEAYTTIGIIGIFVVFGGYTFLKY